jgi:hypothetical protein
MRAFMTQDSQEQVHFDECARRLAALAAEL